jgi:peptidoglycan/LPS O-acetylase OafA/YrhL
VDIFIVLSGFCLMLPLVQSGTFALKTLQFFYRRAMRILPPYYLAMLFSLVLISFFIGKPTGTHWDNALPVTTKSVVSHLLLMQDAVGEDASINHVFWSIAVEWRIYFFFPLLIMIWRARGPLWSTGIAMVGGLALQFILFKTIGAGLTFCYLGLFSLGMFGAGIAFGDTPLLTQWREKIPWGWLVSLGWVPAMLIRETNSELGKVMSDVTVGLWAFALLVAASRQTGERAGWLGQTLGWRPLAFIGTFAYSIYLIHAPLIQLLWQYPFRALQGHHVLMTLVLFFPGVPIILAVSYVFFVCCERPFHRAYQKKRAAPPVLAPSVEPTR